MRKNGIKRAVYLAFIGILLFLNSCNKNKAEKEYFVPNNSLVTDENSRNIVDDLLDAKRLEDAAEQDELVTGSVEDMAINQSSTSVELIQKIRGDLDAITVLGEYKTYYGDSSEDRKSNIENAVKKINNTIIRQGEEFSCYDTIAPFTVENGYRPSGTYDQGKVVQSVGGGVCQISTTLYNAVLFAELKITERNAHSMTVSYVELSRDAAIAGEYKDLKFMNTLKEQVVLRAVTEDGWLIIRVEGIEERDPDRYISFETKVFTMTDPGDDIITVDETLSADELRVTQKEHTGYETKLYKIVYENGTEKERVPMNESSYVASPRYITIGVTTPE